MKTVFITSFNPFIARNILVTDVFKTLTDEPDLRLVVFVPDYKVSYFQENFSGKNVIFEGLKVQKLSQHDVLFNFLASCLVDSQTLAIHKREKLARDRNYFKFAVAWLLRKIFSRSNLFKKLVRVCDLHFMGEVIEKEYFESYRPELLFASDLYHNDDAHFLALAKKFGIPSVGMIRSWDNVTTKGIFRVKPQKLIVHNEIIKREVLRWNDMQNGEIFMSGIPQYDDYINGQRVSRKEFFSKIRLDPNKKLILYSPFGGRFYRFDWQIMEILKELNTQVLVRLTPNDEVTLGEFQPSPNFYIDQPGHQFQPGNFRDTELNKKDMQWLADSLYHSDVLVTCGASIAIDAAVFHKPSVLVFFDGWEKNLPYLESARKWLDFDHAKKLWQIGAVKAATNKQALLDFVKRYLENPRLDEDQRREMVVEQVGKLDGQSGRRIGEFLLGFLAGQIDSGAVK